MHKEFVSFKPDIKKAVLFIHGILGTPRHFDDFIPLVPAGYNIFNVLLDGHGGDVEDFSNTSMKKWEDQISSTVSDILINHDELLIVAHSMGTLLALSESIKYPGKVKKMFFLASPLKIYAKPSLFINSAKIYFNVQSDKDKVLLAAKKSYGIIKNDKKFWKYFCWIPRYRELFSKIKSIRKILEEVQCNVIVFQSKNDEMVSLKSEKYLKLIKNSQIEYLENSSHFYYEEKDQEYILNEFKNFIEQ